MNALIRFLTFVIASSIILVACSSLRTEQEINTKQTIKALLIDGQNNHVVWPKSTVMMKQYLEQSGLFEVDVYRTKPVWRAKEQKKYFDLIHDRGHTFVEQPVSDTSFSPNFSDYDVVISNFGYKAASWPEQTKLAFEEYMNNGGGFVSVHSANNAFPEWPAYNEMTGLGGWGGRNESHGPYVYYDKQGMLILDNSIGEGGAHGKKHEFQLTKRQPHPIMRGLPDIWMHTSDECYGKLRGPAKQLTILATAYCPKVEKGTGRHEPALMTINYGKGRIFHTTLGHHQKSFESVGFIVTFLRGSEWSATGSVTQTVPEDFPTSNHSSVRLFD